MADKVPEVKSEKEKKQISWTFSMDAALTETFLDAYGQNKKYGRVWDEAVYTSVQLAVLAKTQEQVEKAHITSRMRTMRKEYNSFTDLASRSGFGWDPIKQTITAPPSAWIELLADPKSNEKYKGFHDRGPKWPLDHLAIIFGNTYTSGSYSVGGIDSVDLTHMDSVPDLNVENEENNPVGLGEGETKNGTEKRKSSAMSENTLEEKRPHGKKVRVKEIVQDMTSAIGDLKKVVDLAARAEYVCEQVMKIEGFTKRYLRKAYTILMRNPIEKEIFLGGDLELKQEMVEELRDLIGDI
ncbi:hypothetical protein IFM89_037347 [Coptis chinensis]|uniref:Myb/SANT-like domain-containing protein n=1 Tax=Coptis chinensis TaxID=261450 RepID=A0A835IGJ2_9MAGN|nr:hypothetical protein IFM89_037347 [Coptis chinensis]